MALAIFHPFPHASSCRRGIYVFHCLEHVAFPTCGPSLTPLPSPCSPHWPKLVNCAIGFKPWASRLLVAFEFVKVGRPMSKGPIASAMGEALVPISLTLGTCKFNKNVQRLLPISDVKLVWATHLTDWTTYHPSNISVLVSIQIPWTHSPILWPLAYLLTTSSCIRSRIVFFVGPRSAWYMSTTQEFTYIPPPLWLSMTRKYYVDYPNMCAWY